MNLWGQVNKFLENLSEGTRSVMSHYFLTSSISQLITVKFWAEFIAWFHFCKRLKRITFVFFAKWKKNKFHAVIKHLHMKSLTPKEIKAELDSIHLHQRLRLYTIGWMNLNVVVHPHVMHFVRDVQLRLQRQKSSIKSTILFWLIDEWKCASLLRPQVHHMTVIPILHEQLDMKKQDGCRVCWLWTISTGSHVPDINGQIQWIPFELLFHPAYSPDLVPCDYFLFPNLKKWFGGKRPSESNSSSKQRFILKDWTNHIIRTAWKSWRIVGSMNRTERRLCWEIKMNR